MYHRLIAAARRAKQDAKAGKRDPNPYDDDPALRRRYYRSYVAWSDIYKERTK